jgi:hypothetical protein
MDLRRGCGESSHCARRAAMRGTLSAAAALTTTG